MSSFFSKVEIQILIIDSMRVELTRATKTSHSYCLRIAISTSSCTFVRFSGVSWLTSSLPDGSTQTLGLPEFYIQFFDVHAYRD